MARYIIGIDLGTTNIAVAYLDLSKESPKPLIFMIPQVIEEGETKELGTLPSFIFLPSESEYAHGSLDLPWTSNRDYCIGEFARAKASSAPNRTISSAKSWLCVSNVDRLSPILPWRMEDEKRKISPVEAAERCLEHIKDAWNYKSW